MKARLGLGLLLAVQLAGCVFPSSELAFELSSDTLRPGQTVEVRYVLPSPGHVSFALEDTQGRRYVVRDGDLQSQGPHTLPVSAAVDRPDLGPLERRVLPPGQYRYAFRAELTLGRVLERSGSLRVEGGGSVPVALDDVSAMPAMITPNDDGVDDEATLSFRVDRDASVSAYVEGPKGRLMLVNGQRLAPGLHTLSFRGRDQLERPLPDGLYRFVVTAEDSDGNRTSKTVQFRVEESGRALAAIESVTFSPTELRVGEVLRVQATVVNVGRVPLRTQGPDPGYIYSADDTFASVEGHKYAEKAGLWRLGVDWEANSRGAPLRFPFRWGFGHDLQPGERVTLTGYVRFDRPVDTAYPYLYFFASVVQDGSSYPVHRVGRTAVALFP